MVIPYDLPGGGGGVLGLVFAEYGPLPVRAPTPL